MEIRLKMVGFDYEDATITEEINRNICALFATPSGTCAGDRSYGLNQREFLGRPAQIAENIIALEVTEKINKYEPRVNVESVSCTTDLNGLLVATIRIEPNEYYNPDTDDEYEVGEAEETDDEDNADEDYEE